MTSELTRRIIDRRIAVMLAFFGLWLAAVLAMLFNLGVFNRAEYLRRGDDIAVRQFFLHPARGSILDRNLRPLAWSEIHYDLLLSRAALADTARRERMFSLVAPVFPDFAGEATNYSDDSDFVPAVFDLTPEQIAALRDALDRCPDLMIAPRVERMVYDDPAVRVRVGEVSNADNCLSGVSGLEAEYDRVLSGVAEIYEITVDKYGRQKLDTRRVLQAARPGRNVILPYSLEDIENANPDAASDEVKNE